jgi:hypothetical protein
MLLKIKAELLAKPKLQQVIIKTLLGHLDLGSCIFETPSLELYLLSLSVWNHDPIVELPPSANLFDNFGNCSFLGSLFFWFCYLVNDEVLFGNGTADFDCSLVDLILSLSSKYTTLLYLV